MSDDAKKIRFWNRRVNPILGVLVVVLIFAALMFPWAAAVFQFLWALLTGWIFHGIRVFPVFFAHWQAAILPLAVLVLAWLAAHRLLRWWLATRTHDAAQGWALHHSGALIVILMLGSAAAVSISGVVHQAMWLGQTQWTESKGVRPLWIARSQMNHLMVMMYLFNLENGRLPKDLDELRLSEANVQYRSVERTFVDTNGVVLSPMFTKPGAVLEDLDSSTVILISDLVEGHHVIVRADRSDGVISVEDLEKLIARKDWQHHPTK